ncbi:MAG: arginine N-succinyltransferase, partial [Haliangium ochraceum]
MFLFRDIAPGDLDDLQRAAVHLDSVNLPDDRASLTEIIARSRASFAEELPVADRCFVFVTTDGPAGPVLGTSMIFAQHGSRRAPHVFFDVLDEERYSETLDVHFSHRLLRIGYNYKGLTEIGGLVLLPDLRRHPERLGRSLAYVRFLYLAR